MKKFLIFLWIIFCCEIYAQSDTLPYNRKEEIVFDGKRYRKYNNYLTFGVGKAYSDLRSLDQSVINVDFQFHIQRQYLQLGFFMSGDEWLKNNNLQAHLGYGYRMERNKFNLAGFIGPSYAYFVISTPDTSGIGYINKHRTSIGAYVAIQAVYKIKYDVGIGTELFGDFSSEQKIAGIRVIFYFSGAYRGIKKGIVPIKKRE